MANALTSSSRSRRIGQGAAALAHPVCRRPRLAGGVGDPDVAAKADDVAEAQLFQNGDQLLVAEAAIGKDRHLATWRYGFGQAAEAGIDACLRCLAETVPPGCQVTILADGGFGDQKLIAILEELGFGYVIRFRGNIRVADATSETRPAADWVGKGGRALADAARPTAAGQRICHGAAPLS